MRDRHVVACFGALVIAAACGGKVVFVEDDDGSGGSGGAPTSATSTSTKSTTKATTQATTGVTSVTDATTNVAVTSGGPPFCDFGVWGDECEECVQQALRSECAASLDACFGAVPDCQQYDECVFQCSGNQGCCNQCANAVSREAIFAHDQLLACVFCGPCQAQCPDAVPGFCAP